MSISEYSFVAAEKIVDVEKLEQEASTQSMKSTFVAETEIIPAGRLFPRFMRSTLAAAAPLVT
jgi:hypothetical protein